MPPWSYFEGLTKGLSARHLVTRPPGVRVAESMAADLPLDEALHRIIARLGDLEVMDGTRRLGVVGLPELHGKVVRTYLRSGLEGLELLLSEIVRLSGRPPDDWMPFLLPERWAQLENALRMAGRLAPDPVDWLTLPDLLRVLHGIQRTTGSTHPFFEEGLGPVRAALLKLHPLVTEPDRALRTPHEDWETLLLCIPRLKLLGAYALKYVSELEHKRAA